MRKYYEHSFININMKLFFPFLEEKKRFYNASLRLINKLYIKKEDLQPFEIVISKDYLEGITLVGKPRESFTEVSGNFFEKLYNLKINLDKNKKISFSERKIIIDFVSKYAQPKMLGQEQTIIRHFSDNPNNSFFEEGDEIEWLFFPYVSKPQDKTLIDYFYAFRNMLRDFKETVDLIKDNQHFKPGGITSVFNFHLSQNRLYLNPNYGDKDFLGHSLCWISKTSLSLCYLELYSLIISKSKIKLCKYCNSLFVSEKSNRTRCDNCMKDFNLFRRIYYQKHIEIERERARLRMRKHRKLLKYRKKLHRKKLINSLK